MMFFLTRKARKYATGYASMMVKKVTVADILTDLHNRSP